MQKASQQVDVTVISHSVSMDSQLTDDDVDMVTASLMKIKEKIDIDAMEDGNLMAIVTIVANIDVEEAEQMVEKLLQEKVADNN